MSTLVGTSALLTKAGEVLVFDPVKRLVMRGHSNSEDSDYTQNRRILSAYLPTPSCSYDEKHRLIEELVDGVPVATLEPSKRLEIFRDLADLYALYISSAVHREDSQWATLLPEELDTILRYFHLGDATANTSFERFRWPTLLCHGDLSANNVVARADGSIVVIDFDDTVVSPYFRDPLTFVLRDPVLGAAYERGELDPIFDDLDRAARRSTLPGDREAREAAALLWLAEHRRGQTSERLDVSLEALMPRFAYLRIWK